MILSMSLICKCSQRAAEKAVTSWTQYRVTEKKKETPRIVTLVFDALMPSETPQPVQSA